MPADVVIVREEDAYRLMHGHLRLANLLREAGEAWIEVPDRAAVKVVGTPDGYRVEHDGESLPLLPANGFVNQMQWP